MIKIDEVLNTALIKDFIRLNFVPKLDVLLDWRNQLVKMRKEAAKDQDLYNLEIKATDYLIQEYYSNDQFLRKVAL